MKKIITILVLFSILFASTANAQSEKGFYVSTNTGYNFGIAKGDFSQAILLQIGNGTQISASEFRVELAKVKMGSGINAGFNIGYMANKYLGFELGGHYLIGSKTETKVTQLSGDFSTSDLYSRMLQIRPTIVLRGGFSKINPYAKVGIIVGTGTVFLENTQKDGGDLLTNSLEFTGGTPIGFNSSFGALYKINEKLSFFAEANLVTLSYGPDKATIVKATENGVDVLPSIPVQERELIFSDTFLDFGNPLEFPRPQFSFNSFGINIGIQYHF